jgi:transcriptional regulator with XRE-family HTH domain
MLAIMPTRTRHRIVVDDTALARAIGARVRSARLQAGLTQQELAAGRYTKAYVSALENGISKPSMAALTFLAGRLGLPTSHFLTDTDATWSRLAADLELASGRWEQAADAYAALLEGPSDPGQRAELLMGHAEALCRLEKGADAIAIAAEAADTFRTLGRRADAALATYWLAYGQYQRENYREARSLLLPLLDEARSGESIALDLTIRLLIALAAAESAEGQTQAALAYLEEARGLTADLDDRRRASFLYSLAASYIKAGDLEAALRAGYQGLALFRAASATLEVAALDNELALAFLGLGNTSRAEQLAAEARAEFERLGDARRLAHTIETQARVALARGAPDAAIELAREARAVAERSGSATAAVASLLTEARAQVASDRVDVALPLFEQVAELVRVSGTSAQRRDVLTSWADTLARLGRHAEAYELTRQALGPTPS